MREVKLANTTFTRLAKYAQIANISVEQAINDACKEWMDTEGDMLVAFIQRTYKDPKARKGTRAVTTVAA